MDISSLLPVALSALGGGAVVGGIALSGINKILAAIAKTKAGKYAMLVGDVAGKLLPVLDQVHSQYPSMPFADKVAQALNLAKISLGDMNISPSDYQAFVQAVGDLWNPHIAEKKNG